MINILAVGAGGFLGAILRYLLGKLTGSLFPGVALPVGTFISNIIGAFFIGIAFQFFTRNSGIGTTCQLFIMTGILGGFTTFSSFSLETVNMIAEGRLIGAASYVGMSVFLCLIGVFLGKSVF